MMRTLLTLLLFTLFAGSLHAENGEEKTPSPFLMSTSLFHAYDGGSPAMQTASYKQTSYWKKHKTFKYCAWASLGLGLIGTVYGFAEESAGVIGELFGEEKKASAIFIGGLCLTAASVPLFIVSHNYKKKAKAMQVSVGMNSIDVESLTCVQRQPALALQVSF